MKPSVDHYDRLRESVCLRRTLRAAMFVFLLACVLTTSEAMAQYRLDQFTTGNGLPQNTVSAITQTRDGYLWFATYDGLVRYDGIRFTTFDKGNSEGISGNRFLSLCEDGRGTLWAGTSDSGLIRYRDGSFTSFTTQQGLPLNYVGRLQRAEDGLPVVFFGIGENNHIDWANGNSLTSVNIFLWMEDDSMVPIHQRPVTEFADRSNARWALEPGRLIKFKGDRKTVFPVTLTPDVFFRFHYEDRAGNMWFSTRDNEVYLVAGDAIRHYTRFDGITGPTPIKFAGEDSEGNVWLYSDRRVIRYSHGQFTILTEKDGIESRHIRAVFCDRDGAIWIGTNERGLYRLTRRFLTAYSERDGILSNIVYPIYEDRAGNIWIGCGDGMNRFANNRFTSHHLTVTPEGRYKMVSAQPSDKRTENGARSFCEDRKGRLWIGVGKGVLTFKDGSLTSRSELVKETAVDAIFQDSAGNMWMGTQTGLFRERAGASTRFTTKEGLPNDRITVIYEDRQGALWAGTGGGLARLEGDRFVSFTTKEGLIGDRIRSIYEDQDGALWIGTFDSGLSRLKDGRFTSYTTREGLFSNGVFQILEDHSGDFWMSSNRGIYRVSRQQLNDYAEGRVSAISCVAYGAQDGMLSVECNGDRQPAGIRARDGRLWFPNQSGVVVIDPEVVPRNLPPPLAIIESVAINRSEANFKDGIALEPGQGNLEIHYTAPSSIKSEHIQFRIKLDGLSDEWKEAGTQRSVYYPHLPPGRYTFKVIASNIDGVWNETGATLEVYMKPYFYQTRWFFALCIIGAMMLAAGIYGFRVRRLKVNERRLTRLVAERTMELAERTRQLEVANEKLEKLATLDGLTNIPNHRRFKEFLSQEWQRAQRTQAPLSLLLMDVDHFKAYNDTYGHQVGDECLKQVAGVLSQTVHRAVDLAARYGGEEFVVVLTDTDREGAMIVAEKIRAQIEALGIPHSGSKTSDVVTLSIGVATAISHQESDPDGLIAAADQNLYRAKESGRNRCWTEVKVWT